MAMVFGVFSCFSLCAGIDPSLAGTVLRVTISPQSPFFLTPMVAGTRVILREGVRPPILPLPMWVSGRGMRRSVAAGPGSLAVIPLRPALERSVAPSPQRSPPQLFAGELEGAGRGASARASRLQVLGGACPRSVASRERDVQLQGPRPTRYTARPRPSSPTLARPRSGPRVSNAPSRRLS
jgi:hypothetical protein